MNKKSQNVMKRRLLSLVEKTSFAAVFWSLFAAVLAPSDSDSSKWPILKEDFQKIKMNALAIKLLHCGVWTKRT